MMLSKFSFEIVNKEYPFLNVPWPMTKNEHYEVSEYSINIVHEKYKFYNSLYKPFKRNKAKPKQSSSDGWSLVRKNNYDDLNGESPSIHIVCDVFTGKNAFAKDTKTLDFDVVYHTFGNFIPIPEGANFLPGRQGAKGNVDHFGYKLNFIKSLFDEQGKVIDEEEIYQIQKRIAIGFGLGCSARKSAIEKKNKEYGLRLKPLKNNVQLKYWIYFEWKKQNKKWIDFVKANYLQDFVDVTSKDWLPLSFDNLDADKIVKLIIKRGYRIFHGIEADIIQDSILEPIIHALKLRNVP